MARHSETPATGRTCEETANDLYALTMQVSIRCRSVTKREGTLLKDMEMLTLSLLQTHGTLIVGDIQRKLGVLAAQMSRIIRTLEAHDPPLIHCRINPMDKRKIDVSLTEEGGRALSRNVDSVVHFLAGQLQSIPPGELPGLKRTITTLRELLS